MVLIGLGTQGVGVGNQRIAVDRWESNQKFNVDGINSVMACYRPGLRTRRS